MLAHALLYFALLMLISAIMWQLKILWKKHRKRSSLLNILRVNFFWRNIFSKFIYSNNILTKIKIIFLVLTCWKNYTPASKSKQSKVEQGFCLAHALALLLLLLCFAHGLKEPILDCFHEQSKAKQDAWAWSLMKQ